VTPDLHKGSKKSIESTGPYRQIILAHRFNSAPFSGHAEGPGVTRTIRFASAQIATNQDRSAPRPTRRHDYIPLQQAHSPSPALPPSGSEQVEESFQPLREIGHICERPQCKIYLKIHRGSMWVSPAGENGTGASHYADAKAATLFIFKRLAGVYRQDEFSDIFLRQLLRRSKKSPHTTKKRDH